MGLSEQWMARVQEVVDEAHRDDLGGEHRSGFCKACADAYLVAQIAVPQQPQGAVGALLTIARNEDRRGGRTVAIEALRALGIDPSTTRVQ